MVLQSQSSADSLILRHKTLTTNPELTQRLQDACERVLRGFDLMHGFFNLEFFVSDSGELSLIEVNPRLAAQLAQFYEWVLGIDTYEMGFAMALDRPLPFAQTPRFGAAASFVWRSFDGTSCSPAESCRPRLAGARIPGSPPGAVPEEGRVAAAGHQVAGLAPLGGAQHARARRGRSACALRADLRPLRLACAVLKKAPHSAFDSSKVSTEGSADSRAPRPTRAMLASLKPDISKALPSSTISMKAKPGTSVEISFFS